MFGTEHSRPPAPASIEVTILGPGYGEAICVHFGDGRWAIIDSYRHSPSDKPAPIDYLESLGIDTASQVEFVLCTHWHDDHCAGLSEILEVCPKATFCIGQTLTRPEFAVLVSQYNSGERAVSGSRLRELAAVLSHFDRRRNPSRPLRLASEGKTLFQIEGKRISHGNACRVTAISPSDRATQDFLERISSELNPKIGVTRRPAVDVSPNLASVAVNIQIGARSILLGADLEQTSDLFTGWNGVLSAQNLPTHVSDVFKVPHHGSSNAHNHLVWSTLLSENALAIVTPWIRGSRSLPRAGDLGRMRKLTTAGFVSSQSDSHRAPPRFDPLVEREIRSAGIKLTAWTRRLGAVRLRSDPTSSTSPWCVELLGSATSLGS